MVKNLADTVVAEVDPVCGMKVLPQKAAASIKHAGRTWYFCSQGCKAKFEASPGKYDGSTLRVSEPKTSIASQYTCPMHPEVLSPKPGTCPKCGMALEPVAATESTANQAASASAADTDPGARGGGNRPRPHRRRRDVP